MMRVSAKEGVPVEEPSLTSAKSEEELHYGFTAGAAVNFIKTLDIQQSDNLRLTALATTMNVGIAQVAVRAYNSLPDYIREMDFIVRQGVNQRAHIMCFPALSGLLPASLFPQFDKVLSSLQIHSKTGLPHQVWIYQAVSAVASECFEVYYATMSALAAAYGIYIAAGSTIYPESGGFTHRALVFDPTGRLLGQQDKLSVTSLERDLQIEPGGKIQLFETPVGNFTILIGSDVDYFETTRISKKLGASVVFNPTAFVGQYNGVDAAAGLNLRVQELPLYGVQSTLIGRTPFGFDLSGPSGVFGPLRFALPNAKNGMYLRTIKHHQTQVLTARLALDSLHGISDPLLEDTNPEFSLKYVDRLY